MCAIDEFLKAMGENRASDLHLAVGSPPTYRVHGSLVPTKGAPLSPEALKELLGPIVNDEHWERFRREKELDFSYSIPGVSRYRGNLLLQRGTLGAVFRAVPFKVPTLDELGFPPMLKEFCNRPRGLVLVTGPTGSGKSTTLAAMIEHINAHKTAHVITIEDPIEFLHKNQKALIRQRELGGDTCSFATALKHVLRQDPDVVLIGEMRDLETIALALTAAETGHLVLGTLHTTSAPATVDRIADVFPPHQQQQTRVQLASILEGVISQTLIPAPDQQGRVCAMEILVGTLAVRNLIREGKSHQILSIMQGGAKLGMVTLDAALRDLVAAGKVAFEEALIRTADVEGFKKLCGRT
ncbi:MAG: type IV pilus twitching motility protein PilT [Candidatus Omnitrophica bacterium]|nr:type IV pilus twitching motility protein PilT [Candidatus Omnitrophota bacterium]